MKQYFAKYLPADGEMKEGDRVYFDDPNKNLTDFGDWSGYALLSGIGNGHYMIDLRHITTDADLKNLKKVKLSLCSRDIQVGDKVKLHQTKDEYKQQNFNVDGKVVSKDQYQCVIHIRTGENYLFEVPVPNNYCMKVIGEISPQATWVKERDEFDETMIADLNHAGFISKFQHHLTAQELRNKGQWKIAIKGPCGHFH